MTSLVTKFITRKIFNEVSNRRQGAGHGNQGTTHQNVQPHALHHNIGPQLTTFQNATDTDPYFEYVPATRLGGMVKTKKRQKKANPPGLTPEEQKILTKVKSRAYRLDLCLFNLCGFRFGWSSLIGFIPG